MGGAPVWKAVESLKGKGSGDQGSGDQESSDQGSGDQGSGDQGSGDQECTCVLSSQSILLGMGLQHKTVEVLEVVPLAAMVTECMCEEIYLLPWQKELGLPSTQVMGLFNRSVRKFSTHFTELVEGVVGREIPLPAASDMVPLEHTVDQELVRGGWGLGNRKVIKLFPTVRVRK